MHQFSSLPRFMWLAKKVLRFAWLAGSSLKRTEREEQREFILIGSLCSSASLRFKKEPANRFARAFSVSCDPSIGHA